MLNSKTISDDTKLPPFETRELRKLIQEFLNIEVFDSLTHKNIKIGNYKFGVYAFFDYDGEPIYVGQTNEKLRVRIGRHLTNQRTDAVAMNVLDPFEVFEIEIWPLPVYEVVSSKNPEAQKYLNALEYEVFITELGKSQFNAVLNEKDPPEPNIRVSLPKSYRCKIVSEAVYDIRKHPDIRIARRASVLARLAQVISERQVQGGLRKTLLTQAKRLAWLAERRYNALVKEVGDDE
jgi:GIY-YIG catalytic domain